jgi:ubiquinol oxidase
MHLLTCLTMFKANRATRLLVILGQMLMTPALMLTYAVHPKSVHRFVGYLEETAVHTYINIISHVEQPGTHLHKDWAHLPAPPIAVGYWRLPADAKWVDALNCMMADEAHHRDVNHTFATLKADDPNPFVLKHREDASKAWRLENDGKHAWESRDKPL